MTDTNNRFLIPKFDPDEIRTAYDDSMVVADLREMPDPTTRAELREASDFTTPVPSVPMIVVGFEDGHFWLTPDEANKLTHRLLELTATVTNNEN